MLQLGERAESSWNVPRCNTPHHFLRRPRRFPGRLWGGLQCSVCVPTSVGTWSLDILNGSTVASVGVSVFERAEGPKVERDWFQEMVVGN
jgi:hypothetical protein